MKSEIETTAHSGQAQASPISPPVVSFGSSLSYYALVQHWGRFLFRESELRPFFADSPGLIKRCRNAGWLEPSVKSSNRLQAFDLRDIVTCSLAVKRWGAPPLPNPHLPIVISTDWERQALLLHHGRHLFRRTEIPMFFACSEQLLNRCLHEGWIKPCFSSASRCTVYDLSDIVDCTQHLRSIGVLVI